jgi:hypothetical protein
MLILTRMIWTRRLFPNTLMLHPSLSSGPFSTSTGLDRRSLTGSSAISNATQLLKAYSQRVLQTGYYENYNHTSQLEDSSTYTSRFTSTQEIASLLCQAYFQLVNQQQQKQHQTQVGGGGELQFLTAQQEQVLNHFALELGAVNPTIHELDTVRAAAHDSASLIRYETILQKRIRPMCIPQYERIFASLLTHVGMKFLVQLRQDLLHYIHQIQHLSNPNYPNSTATTSEFCLFRLKLMNEDMKKMFSAWFSAGLLG